MSLSNIRNLAYSILKKLGDVNVKDAEFIELEKCPQCDKDILSSSFEAFTVLSCGCVFHRECVEKNCLITDCSTTVVSSQTTTAMQEMDVDEVDVVPAPVHSDDNNKKRSDESTDASTSKKSKKDARPEDSNVLKKLIRELSIGIPKASEVKVYII